MLGIFNYESKNIEDVSNNYIQIKLTIDTLISGKQKVKKPNPNILIAKITEQAKFKGGKKALVKYFKENLKYPKEALKKDIQGRVYVKFKISEYGKIKNVKIIRSIYPTIDNEAKRLIKEMPDWIPAKSMDAPIKSEQILPVIFMKIKNKETYY